MDETWMDETWMDDRGVIWDFDFVNMYLSDKKRRCLCGTTVTAEGRCVLYGVEIRSKK